MSTVADVCPRVHSECWSFEDNDTYTPTRTEEVYWSAFTAAESGEDPAWPEFTGPDRGDLWHAWASERPGMPEVARESAEAREIGRTLGYSGSGICEPPPGFARHQAEAYRAGFAEGELEFEADREFEAWVISVEEERMAEAFAVGFTDADIWPLGCVS